MVKFKDDTTTKNINNNSGKDKTLKINHEVFNSDTFKKFKKKLLIFVITLIILFAGVIGTYVGLQFTGINKGIRDVMRAYRKYDINTLVGLSSEIYYYSEDSDYVETYFKDAVGGNLDYYEESVGHDYKLSYEVEDVYNMSARNKDKLFEKLKPLYTDYDLSSITNVKIAEIKVKVRNGRNSDTNNIKLTFTKEGKDWGLLYIE